MLSAVKLKEIEDFIIKQRRYFHCYPELSGYEEHTSQMIADILSGMGIKVQKYSGNWGVCGIIEGEKPGPVIALRADMDALPIEEENDVHYRSKYKNIMHACGHDCHMAIVLGAAKILSEKRDFAGTVKLIFQPSEEAAPVGGAQAMIDEGVLLSPEVDMIFGLHVWPGLPLGQIGIKAGSMEAGSDRLTIKIIGKESHAITPHKGVDAISVAGDVINGISKMISRRIDPIEQATISIGTIAGGSRYNILAKEVILEGTVRTLNQKTRDSIPEKLKQLLNGITQAHGASFDLSYRYGYPPLINWEEPAQIVMVAVEKVLGRDSLRTDIKPVLGAEDFSRYMERVPGAYFWLGCGDEDDRPPLHSAKFDVDEGILLPGARIMSQIAVSSMEHLNKNHINKSCKEDKQ